MIGHRASWRLSRRLVLRAPGRSALVAALVAAPVVAGAFAETTIRTAQLSPEQAATRHLGHADAIAVVTPWESVTPDSHVGRGPSFSGEQIEASSGGDHPDRPAVAVDLSALLPAAAHAVPEQVRKSTEIRVGGRSFYAIATTHEFSAATGNGIYQRVSGRVPVSNDEVAVTPRLAAQARLRPGTRVVIDGRSLEVSGVVRDLSALSTTDVVGSIGAFGGLRAFTTDEFSQDVTWLIAFDGPTPDLHDVLAARGVIYETRSQWKHPGPSLLTQSHVNPETVAVLASVALFGIAEIVLLAGTAIAVGTRRQIRELGLLQAVGGDERDVRHVVLGQAVVVGIAGGVIGAVLGMAAVAGVRPRLERVANQAFGPLDARPWELLLIAGVGVVAALLAAVVPARGSTRLPVVDMMRMRFPSDHRPRNPRWAWAALALGPAIVVVAALGWHHARVTASGGDPSSRDAWWTVLVTTGAFVTLAGLARSVPMLLTRAGARAGRLPLGPRLAVRDCARHWHRSAPATAAVATIVAASVLVLFVVSSTDLRNRRQYQPSLPKGMVAVMVPDDASGGHPDLLQAAREVQAVWRVPAAGVVSLLVPPSRGRGPLVMPLGGPDCTDHAAVQTGACMDRPAGVADAGTIGVILGRVPPAAALQMLMHGGAVVFDPALLDNGHVALDVFEPGTEKHETVRLPAALAAVNDPGELPTVVVSASTAAAHGWHAQQLQAVMRPDHVPSKHAVSQLRGKVGDQVQVYVERGYHGSMGIALLALLVGSSLTALAGTSIAVALAMAESRSDMATLAAVGAGPGRRRLHAMSAALTVGGLGTALGLPLGVLVGVALLRATTGYPLSVPVRWTAMLLVIVPTLGVAVAGSVTRSRVPMTRRTT